MEVLLGVFVGIWMIVMMLFLMVLLVALCGYLVTAYILEGKALSAIACRRGIDKPWLAWVPFAKMWLLGSISDQYRYVVHGQVRNRRKLLLWLNIVFTAVTSVYLVGTEIWSFGTILAAGAEAEAAYIAAVFGGALLIYLGTFVYLAVAAVASVFQYMALYDVFRSCDPGKSLVYLLVSIFTSYPLPFFLYSCRDKDLGMPPRTDAPAPVNE